MKAGQRMQIVAQAMIVAAIVLAFAGILGLGALRGGVVPPFRQITFLGAKHALVVESGPFCVPDAPLAACHSRVRHELRVWYYTRSAKHELLTYSWRD